MNTYVFWECGLSVNKIRNIINDKIDVREKRDDLMKFHWSIN